MSLKNGCDYIKQKFEELNIYSANLTIKNNILEEAMVLFCPQSKESYGTRQDAILDVKEQINEEELEVFQMDISDAWIAGLTPCSALWYFFFDYVNNRGDQGKIFVIYDPRIKKVVFHTIYSTDQYNYGIKGFGFYNTLYSIASNIDGLPPWNLSDIDYSNEAKIIGKLGK